MLKIIFTTVLFCAYTLAGFAQTESLKQNIEKVLLGKNATVGVSLSGISSKDFLNINNEQQFPLQSVFKFHVALAVLNQVDKGKFKLNQKILIKKSDLLPNTWSPIREKYPNGNVKLPLADILKHTVAESDNNGCDILLELIGGPKVVNDYIHGLCVKDFAISANEEEMHQDWNNQFRNWTTPKSSTDLLKLFYEQKILSSQSYDFLWEIMAETTSGKNRIKGQLPAGTIVAHKTGTSDTNNQGVTAAINDAGIVILPNGKAFALSVFVANSKETNETNEKIIADIAKLTWNYFITRQD